MRSGAFVGYAAVLALAGCASVGDNPNRKVAPPVASPDVRMLAGAVLPAIYQGTLPCADCAGIRYVLDLRADRVFFLRTTYLGKGAGDGESFDDIGTWRAAADAQSITLNGNRGAPLMFSIENTETLRKLDSAGKPIASTLSDELKRNASYKPLEPRVPMRGMYAYMADAGIFRECTTQLKLPVAQVAENAVLERTYLGARKEPGQELLVSLEGQIAMRPNADTGMPVPTLVVERLIKVLQGADCGTDLEE